MIKKTLIIFLTLSTLLASAQKKQNIYYVKYNGKFVFNKDSADYIRIIQEPDSGSVNYILMELYPDGGKRRLGSVSRFEPYLVLEGTVIQFYKNGQRESVEIRNNNVIIGNAYYYYPNGKLKTQQEYLKKTVNNIPYKTIQFANTDGKNFLDKNATGRVDITASGKTILAGNYLNGFKNGEWTEYVVQDSLTYIELFDNGKFVNGKALKNNGDITTFDKLEIAPEFKGGFEAFGRFLQENLHYPSFALNKNVEGRVVLQFVIEKDGSVAEAKVLNGIGSGCDEEAFRILKLSPKWKPGLHRGKPINVSLTIPIIFRKGNVETPFQEFPQRN